MTRQKDLKPVCRWAPDQSQWYGDTWDTGCGNKFEFTFDGPHLNHFKFCPYCGRPLIEKKGQG